MNTIKYPPKLRVKVMLDQETIKTENKSQEWIVCALCTEGLKKMQIFTVEYHEFYMSRMRSCFLHTKSVQNVTHQNKSPFTVNIKRIYFPGIPFSEGYYVIMTLMFCCHLIIHLYMPIYCHVKIKVKNLPKILV